MEEYKEIFGFLSVALSMFGSVPYAYKTYKGEVKPHIFTWIIWCVVMSVVVAVQLSEGAGAGVWMTAYGAISCFVIALLGWLKCGDRFITRSDWVALVVALSAVPLWVVTDDPLWSVILVTFIDCVGYYPTIRKSYYRPFDEYLTSYVIFIVAFVFALLALEEFSITNAFYPALIALVNAAFVPLVLMWRRRGVIEK